MPRACKKFYGMNDTILYIFDESSQYSSEHVHAGRVVKESISMTFQAPLVNDVDRAAQGIPVGFRTDSCGERATFCQFNAASMKTLIFALCSS